MALRSVHGYSAPEVEQGLSRARELCTVSGEVGKRFSVEWGLFQCTIVKGDIADAQAFAAGLLEHAGNESGEAMVDAISPRGWRRSLPASSSRPSGFTRSAPQCADPRPIDPAS
jgi:hypothetical protein